MPRAPTSPRCAPAVPGPEGAAFGSLAGPGTAASSGQQNRVLNHCPLVFLEASGRNFTPDKPPAAQRREVENACNDHLAAALDALRPQWAIGVGGFAERCLRAVLEGDRVDSAFARRAKVAQIPHPNPASPAANRGWADAVDRTLAQLGVLPPPR